jgi:hypothetical protein
MPVAIAMRSVAASSPSSSVRSPGGEPPIQMAPNPSASTSRGELGGEARLPPPEAVPAKFYGH